MNTEGKSTKEIWKAVEGFKGCYEISNLGRLRSLTRLTGGKKPRRLKGRIIKECLDKDGYVINVIHKDGNKTAKKRHRLVAEAFIPNPKNKPQINHINEVKVDNRADNLEWVTNQENRSHGTLIERASESLTNGKMSKPVYQYDLDGNFIKEYPSTREATRDGFHSSCISVVCNGKYKQHRGFIWSYTKL